MKKKILPIVLALFLCLAFGSTTLAEASAPNLTLENDAAIGEIVEGLTASADPLTAQSILPAAMALTNDDARILAADEDAEISPEDTVGTGMRLVWADNDEPRSATFIVRGDVIGSGRLSIAQLVRMSRAVAGSESFTGAELLAADFDGSGEVDITDLVAEANLLSGAPTISEEEKQAIIEAAVALQTDGDVYAADSFSVTLLRAGDTVYGMLPGQSAFYTDEATVRECDGNYVTMYQELQMLPHPEYGFRTQLGVYVVKQDMWVATGLCLANSFIEGQYVGDGGGLQYVIPDYESTLELKETVDLHA